VFNTLFIDVWFSICCMSILKQNKDRNLVGFVAEILFFIMPYVLNQQNNLIAYTYDFKQLFFVLVKSETMWRRMIPVYKKSDQFVVLNCLFTTWDTNPHHSDIFEFVVFFSHIAFMSHRFYIPSFRLFPCTFRYMIIINLKAKSWAYIFDRLALQSWMYDMSILGHKQRIYNLLR